MGQNIKVRPVGPYIIQYSNTADRANPLSLEGAIVQTNAYVFVTPTAGVSEVIFFYGSNIRSDTASPFDLIGDDGGGSALPVNFESVLGLGDNTIFAVIIAGSNIYTVQSTFTVTAASASPVQVAAVTSIPTPTVTQTSGTNTTVTPNQVGAVADVGDSSPLGFAGPGTVGTAVQNHSLTTIAGNYSMAQNEVLEDKNLTTGSLTMQVGVTVRNVRVKSYTDLFNGGGFMEYCDLGPTSGQETTIFHPALRRAISFAEGTIRRCDIRGMIDGAFGGGNLYFDDCWFHGNYKMAVDPDQGNKPSHCDSVAITKGNGRLLRCRIDMFPWRAGDSFDQWDNGAWPLPSSAYAQSGQTTGTQVIIIGRTSTSSPRINGWTIDSCRIAGYIAGQMIIIFADSAGSSMNPINLSFTNNVIDVRGIASARRILSLGTGVEDPVWTNNTLATDYTAPGGNFYAAGFVIPRSLAKTNMQGW